MYEKKYIYTDKNAMPLYMQIRKQEGKEANS